MSQIRSRKKLPGRCIVLTVVTGEPVKHESTVGSVDRLGVSGGHADALCDDTPDLLIDMTTAEPTFEVPLMGGGLFLAAI